MIVLVAFATVEGHTGKIARRIATAIEEAGHQVVLADLAQPGFAIPGAFDAAILCGPIHMGRYPQALMRFAQTFKAELMARPSALVTVSLAIASTNRDEVEEARAYPAWFSAETGFEPTIRYNTEGALKYVEYDFFKRWIMRRIAQQEGEPVDVTRDHELTDWPALDGFVQDFLAKSAKAALERHV
jgi:menaquinone-dependent protoporphyrinogen oxidase